MLQLDPGSYLNVQPSKKAILREREKLKSLTSRHVCFKPLPQLIGELNRHLRSWANYFDYGYPRKSFRQINAYVQERLLRHLRRRSQRPYRPPAELSHYEHYRRMGLKYL